MRALIKYFILYRILQTRVVFIFMTSVCSKEFKISDNGPIKQGRVGKPHWYRNLINIFSYLTNFASLPLPCPCSSLSGSRGTMPWFVFAIFSPQDWCFSGPKDTWDDSWQPSGLVNGMKGEVQKQEALDAQEKNTGTTRIQKVNV